MTERNALILATLLHMALLLGLSLELAGRLPKMMNEPDVTPIEFVEVADVPTVTELPKPSLDAAPRESERPAPAEITPPPPPEPQAPTPPVPPEPAPPPVTKAADTPPQDAIVEAPKPPVKPAPPKAAPPPPKAKPKAQFDAGALASLIDKSKAEAPVKPRETSQFAKSIEKAIPKQAQLSAIQAATLEQSIRSQIAPCWNPPLGGEDVAQMTAVLRIRLNRDGSVAQPPEFVSQTGATSGNQAYARAFVETARRAVLRCAPLELPDNLYAFWREFELNFDPRLMT